jgi:hypothetical protein
LSLSDIAFIADVALSMAAWLDSKCLGQLKAQETVVKPREAVISVKVRINFFMGLSSDHSREKAV